NVDVDWDFFASGMIPPATSAEDFLEGGHNVWCLTADFDDAADDSLPLLFSRNLKIKRLDDPVLYNSNKSGHSKRLNVDGITLHDGTKAFVVITKGGAGHMMFGENLQVGTDKEPGPFRKYFDVRRISEPDHPTATNRILRPVGF
ncbi:MAG: hypothetical protein AAF492_10275, partial [Verrucomicrobiota bacterium]